MIKLSQTVCEGAVSVPHSDQKDSVARYGSGRLLAFRWLLRSRNSHATKIKSRQADASAPKTVAVPVPGTTTTRGGHVGDLFVVVAVGSGMRVQMTAGSPVAAAAAAQLWRDHPGHESMTVAWSLRDDLSYPRPVLLFTQTPDRVVHATPLVAGKPASAHPKTCCGLGLDWEAGAVRVCWPEDGPPCPACLTAFRNPSCQAGEARSIPLGRHNRPDRSECAAQSPTVPPGVTDQGHRRSTLRV